MRRDATCVDGAVPLPGPPRTLGLLFPSSPTARAGPGGALELPSAQHTASLTCATRTKSLLRFVQQRDHQSGGGAGLLALPGRHGVIVLPVVIRVEEFLEPLNKFEIVLEFPFH